MENSKLFECKDYEFYFEKRKECFKKVKGIAIGAAILILLASIIVGIADSQNEVLGKYGMFLEESKFANFGLWFVLGGIVALLSFVAIYFPILIAEINDANMRILIYEVNSIKEKIVNINTQENAEKEINDNV